MSRFAEKMLLVAWDGADWRFLQPLLDAGLLPALEGLIDTGCVGYLSSIQPDVDPMLWTSLVTGKRADRHGVLTHTEALPDAPGVRIVVGGHRQCNALWELLNRSGLTCSIVGWPLFPAEVVNGAFVTEVFSRTCCPSGAPEASLAGTVYPHSLIAELEEFRVRPDEITTVDLKPLLPLVDSLACDYEDDLQSLKEVLANTATMHAGATWLMEHAAADFTMVCYDLLDRAGHRFMRFHPPRQQHVPADSFALWHRVMAGLYQLCDRMLGRLLELAGPETAVMLVSPHGFHCDGQRPSGCKNRRSDVAWHRNFGTFILRAPGVLRDEWMWGGGLLDVVPTILALFGLPVGRDMDGRVLRQAFSSPPEVHFIPTWETNDHRKDVEVTEDSTLAFRSSLTADGYLTDGEFADPERQLMSAAELQYLWAIVHLESARTAQAVPLLQSLHVRFPDEPRFTLQLARARQDLGEYEECRQLVEEIVRRGLSPINTALLLSTVRWKEGDHQGAIQILFDAEQSAPEEPALHCQIGEIYLDLGRWEEASRAFRKVLGIDRESTRAWHGLSVASLARGQFERAADQALNAIGLTYFLPLAHFHLGVALARLGDSSRAIRAFEVCLDQRPETNESHVWLSALYSQHDRDQQKAAYHRKLADESKLKTRSLGASHDRVCFDQQSPEHPMTNPIDFPRKVR